jgi:hypothetical protein
MIIVSGVRAGEALLDDQRHGDGQGRGGSPLPATGRDDGEDDPREEGAEVHQRRLLNDIPILTCLS